MDGVEWGDFTDKIQPFCVDSNQLALVYYEILEGEGGYYICEDTLRPIGLQWYLARVHVGPYTEYNTAIEQREFMLTVWRETTNSALLKMLDNS